MKRTLSPDELARYHRHIILPEVGLEGQTRLKSASVLLVGVGGLGSPVALYLAAAGVGRIGLVDDDRVDHSNIHRQILFGDGDVGRLKVEVAKERLAAINPHIEIISHPVRLTSANAMTVANDYDIVVDGSDNFPTRYLVNDFCVLQKKPDVYGSIFRFEGQATVFDATRGPCYRCLYPEPPPSGAVPSCAEAGVLGVLPGFVGTVQAIETIKLIIGKGEGLLGRLILFDSLSFKIRELKVEKDPDCPICGMKPSVRELIDYEQFCNAQQKGDLSMNEITVAELKQRLDKGENLCIVDVREPSEFEVCKLPNARLIPLKELQSRVSELDRNAEIVVHCHHGKRGEKAFEILRATGFTKCSNLTGGIHAWASLIDPKMRRY